MKQERVDYSLVIKILVSLESSKDAKKGQDFVGKVKKSRFFQKSQDLDLKAVA